MPGKRKGDQLTGGTGDVNPQYFTLPFSTPATPTVSAVAAPLISAVLPIPRFPEKGGKSIVMEFLNVEFAYIGLPSVPPTGAAASANCTTVVALTTNPNAFPGTGVGQIQLLTDPRTVQYDVQALQVFGAGVATVYNVGTIKEYNLTDTAGHGILVATDNIFIQVIVNNGFSTAVGALSAVCIIAYRFKEVGLAEYVGIVQSQQ